MLPAFPNGVRTASTRTTLCSWDVIELPLPGEYEARLLASRKKRYERTGVFTVLEGAR